MSKTFSRVTHYASRFTSSDSGINAELFPAYSGGTVMDLHHLPRHLPNLFLDPVPFVKGRQKRPTLNGKKHVRGKFPSHGQRDSWRVRMWMLIHEYLTPVDRLKNLRSDHLSGSTIFVDTPLMQQKQLIATLTREI